MKRLGAFAVCSGFVRSAARRAALRLPTRSERGLALATYLIGAWTILVTAGIFSGAPQRWLTFASAVAIVGLSVAGQVAGLLASERPAVRPVVKARAA